MRRGQTRVKAKDLTPGMVVRGSWMGPSVGYAERTVVAVRRARDELEEWQQGCAKAKGLNQARYAAERLLEACKALEYNGREARLVTFRGATGQAQVIHYGSQDELDYLRQATVA